MGAFIDITGNRYGKLTVLERADNKVYITRNGKKVYEARFRCKCECGEITVIRSGDLRRGITKSCGCMNRPHGMQGSRLYSIWVGMKHRCNYHYDKSYCYYGGRGIKVCDEWKRFEPFMKWAYDNGYDDSLTIDRIDVNGNYEPQNCRWTTWSIQSRNKRSSLNNKTSIGREAV